MNSKELKIMFLDKKILVDTVYTIGAAVGLLSNMFSDGLEMMDTP